MIYKKICVIGTGWYGCYISEYLLDNYSNIDITILEKNNDLFTGSSYKNQNRLHLGYHYPRCPITREKCKKNYNKFLNKYTELVKHVDKNYYCISKNNSNISFNNYIKLYNDYEVVHNNFLNNIDGHILNTNEGFIDFKKTKKYFKKKFHNRIKIKYNYYVKTIKNKDGVVRINNELEFSKVFNCTYNQYQIESPIIYEKCLTLLYKKIEEVPFDCLTIMDGNFSSIYLYYDNIYTLTNVTYTPLIKSYSFKEVREFNNYDLYNIKKKFEKNILNYYKDFKKKFKYYDFYESFKCKNISDLDSRDINIKIDKNIFNVWCGKISFVCELDFFIKNFLSI